METAAYVYLDRYMPMINSIIWNTFCNQTNHTIPYHTIPYYTGRPCFIHGFLFCFFFPKFKAQNSKAKERIRGKFKKKKKKKKKSGQFGRRFSF